MTRIDVDMKNVVGCLRLRNVLLCFIKCGDDMGLGHSENTVCVPVSNSENNVKKTPSE